MLLGAAGVNIHPDQIAPHVYLPERQGSLQVELIAACRKYGRIPYVITPDLSSLIAELKAGRPVLVLQNYGLESIPAYHYAVVFGVLSDGRVLLHSGTDERLEMSMPQFLMSWERTGAWGIIALKPGELPARPNPLCFLAAVNSFEAKGHMAEAEKSYLAALTLWPDNEIFLFALGNNYLLRNETDKAESLFQKVLALDANHIAAANNLAEIYFQKGCNDQAAIVISHAVQVAQRLHSPFMEIVLQTQAEILQRLGTIDPFYIKTFESTSLEISNIQCPYPLP